TTHSVSKFFNLKGRWNASLITRDILILAGILSGGIWMILQHFSTSFKDVVHHE
nr:6K2 protein [Wild onion symptomless virus]